MYSKGTIVTIKFPFTDHKGFKVRPALVIKDLPGDDIILCAITSKAPRNLDYAIKLETSDIEYGTLNQESYIRLDQIQTVLSNNILSMIGLISKPKHQETFIRLSNMFKPE